MTVSGTVRGTGAGSLRDRDRDSPRESLWDSESQGQL